MKNTPSPALAALAVVGALCLTACGSGSESGPSPDSATSASSSASPVDATALLKRSLATAKKATTYRIVADGTDGGQPLKLDLHYGGNGVDGSVVTMGTNLKIKVIGQTVYFQAPRAFWRQQGGAQGDAVAAMYGAKWVKTSSTSGFGKGFDQFSDPRSFLDQFTSGFESGGLERAKQVGKGTVDGTATTTLGDDTGEGTVDVAASGTPYPLKISLTPEDKSADAGTVTLSDWNEAYTVRPPKSSLALPS